jgi:hypothetical protein
MKSYTTSSIVKMVKDDPALKELFFNTEIQNLSQTIPVFVAPAMTLRFFASRFTSSAQRRGDGYQLTWYPKVPAVVISASVYPHEIVQIENRPPEFWGYRPWEYNPEEQKSPPPYASPFELGRLELPGPFPLAEPERPETDTDLALRERRFERLYALTDAVIAFHLRSRVALSDAQRQTLDDYGALFRWYAPRQYLRAYRALDAAHFDWAIAPPDGGSVQAPYRG